MRYLTTLLFAALSFSAFSQNNAIHVYPWNPDANHNNSIGTDDLLPFLSVFGEEFGLPPEPCTYDGTEFEDLLFGIFDETIILDSIFVEYEIEDVANYYVQGCPDPITDTLVIAGFGMLTDVSITPNFEINIGGQNQSTFGTLTFQIFYHGSSGNYNITFFNWHIWGSEYAADGFFGGGQYNAGNSAINQLIPFPETFLFNEDGIEMPWNSNWASFANYMHILPYWHYADE